MNNLEDLIQRGYFQQYKQDRNLAKGSQEADPERKSTPEMRKNHTSGISNSEAHLRAATAP